MSRPKWTASEVALLERLWAKRLSSFEIAEGLTTEFGRPFTHFSVLCRLSRMGLPAPPRAKRRNLRALGGAASPAAPGRPRRAPAPPPIVDAENLVTIFELGRRSCRYVHGDPRGRGLAKIYCGLTTPEGASFCDGHAGLIYKPDEKGAFLLDEKGA